MNIDKLWLPSLIVSRRQCSTPIHQRAAHSHLMISAFLTARTKARAAVRCLRLGELVRGQGGRCNAPASLAYWLHLLRLPNVIVRVSVNSQPGNLRVS